MKVRLNCKKNIFHYNLTVSLKIILFLYLPLSINLFAQTAESRMTPEDRQLFNKDKFYTQYSNKWEHTSVTRAMDTGDSLNVRLVGRWANGPCLCVDVEGSIAYFSNGAYLDIVDFSDPGNPVDLGKVLLPELPYDIAVSNNYVYVTCTNTGLQIIDATNPANPHKVGFIATNSWAYGVDINGSYLYLADGGGGLRIFDVTDPTNPIEIAISDISDARGVARNNNYVYVIDWFGYFSVIDISQPSNPIEVGVLHLGKYTDGLAVSGNYAYVISSFDSMRVIDVSNPTNPIEVGFFGIGNHANDITISGNYIYVSEQSDGLRVFDISSPNNPMEITYIKAEGYTQSVAISDNYAYTASLWAGLRVVDINSLTNPQEVGYYNTCDFATDVDVNGDYAYVAASWAGLRIIDVSSPNYPTEVGSFITEDYINESLAINENYAYLAYRGVLAIDVSNPNNPEEIGNFDFFSGHGIAIKENYAYFACGDYGLRIIDISNPTNLNEVGFINTDGYSCDVAVADNYAYLSDGNGLRVIDIGNTSNPQEVGFYETGENTHELAVEGNYVFIANGFNGLRIIDVTNPTSPTEIGFYDPSGYLFGVAVRNSLIYMGYSGWGLRIIDARDPTKPIEIGYFDTASDARGITVDSNYIYLADGYDGIYILEYTGPIAGTPGTPVSTQPEDNSFTNTTSPELSWNVPADNEGDMLHFKVEIATDSDFVNHISGGPFESQKNTTGFDPAPPVAESSGQCSFTPINSLSEGDYWWRVTAWDGQEYGNTSSSRKFTVDTSPPYTSDHSPAADEINVPLTTDIVVHIQDSISGVDSSGIIMKINDEIVIPDITGTTSDYTLTYDPPADFEYDQQVTVSIDAQDNAGNSMETETWSFHTESMYVVSTPIIPTGLSDAGVGESITFSSGGSTSDLGDDLDYRFDFGDGTISAWGDSIQSHIYLTVGTFIVKAQARSKIDTTVISNWSSGQTITLSGHQLALTVNGSGSVIADPQKSEYNHDEKVILTAVPANNYQFDHWQGRLSGSNNPDSLIMDSDITITAVFTELAERISILPNPFTPNNDGYNDYVSFKYPEMETREAIVRIFNLRGRKVSELNHSSGNIFRWYGEDEDGKTLEPGVYLYMLEVDNKKISSGTITLVR